jgi:hypothetical protein
MSQRDGENVYSAVEETMLAASFKGGMTDIDDLAEALGKTPGSIAWRLNKLGLLKISLRPTGTGNFRTYEYETLVRMQGDRRFKLAMLAAIKAGLEDPIIGVVRDRSARYIPTVRPPSPVEYRSSAAWLFGA